MRLTVLGGGGFRVPLVYQALLEGHGDVGIEEVVLHDVDARRLEAIGSVLRQLAEQAGRAPRVTATTDLEAAVLGASFVFSAIRVGGLQGRVIDERVALDHGVLGQETVGPGGLAYGLRTVPVMTRIAETVARLAPDAWLINFTNPAGMVTEALSRVLGDRVVGICDTPQGLCRRVARALGEDRMWFDYFGLNHLGWLRSARARGRDRLPELLADEARLTSFEEGRLFGVRWIRALGMIPNEYLYYYYNNAEAVRAISEAGTTRGEFLLAQQESFYESVRAHPEHALAEWRRVRHERDRTYLGEGRTAAGLDERDSCDVEGGGYEEIALALMAAIAQDRGDVLILNVRNRSAIPSLDADAVVEVPCYVDANGPVPVAVGEVPQYAAGLMNQLKAVERAVIDAALTGSPDTALDTAFLALGLHPLVPSTVTAGKILDGYVEQHPQLRTRFT
ncbi:6-phospho-beta-glucosidase [Carbonactinospora thermoautotrophica]|uniref:6-phospho-beta-glucosidase n=1 Tax=Carbonactinospora thermoautotrophica TaxID=1469144 RepID=UPI00226DA50C|nr:6-phospho-beta-glucosidase [Carbonactinospora thermoautotrophica]MCX9191020.1 6-phospho-beta-glucosidase [Carbonactinospora thermoautotrophica]